MNIIEQTLTNLTIGNAIMHDNLTLFPLLSKESTVSEYLTSKRVHYAMGRSKKMEQVNASLLHRQSRASDQGEGRSNISEKLTRMKSHSDTDAMADIYDQHESALDEFCNAFTLTQLQVGAIFAINGEIRGLELFDERDICHKLMPKLIQSYALDAIDMAKKTTTSISNDAIANFLHETHNIECELFPAIGLGEDVRFDSAQLCGGALTHNEKLVHLCLFRINNETRDDDDNYASHIRAASARSRSRKYH